MTSPKPDWIDGIVNLILFQATVANTNDIYIRLLCHCTPYASNTHYYTFPKTADLRYNRSPVLIVHHTEQINIPTIICPATFGNQQNTTGRSFTELNTEWRRTTSHSQYPRP